MLIAHLKDIFKSKNHKKMFLSALKIPITSLYHVRLWNSGDQIYDFKSKIEVIIHDAWPSYACIVLVQPRDYPKN